MHALKIMVGAAAALMVGATSAQMLDPWQTGEAWSGDFSTQVETHGGAYGRAYGDGGMPAEPAKLTIANEAYDGSQLDGSKTASGAFGRPFGEPGLTREQVMAEIDTARSQRLHSEYVGGD